MLGSRHDTEPGLGNSMVYGGRLDRSGIIEGQ